MACGGCGGGKISPKVIQRKAIESAARPKEIQYIAPRDTSVIVQRTKINKPQQTVQKARFRAANTKICPTCGAGVRTIIAGSGPKKRLICNQCGRQFAR